MLPESPNVADRDSGLLSLVNIVVQRSQVGDGVVAVDTLCATLGGFHLAGMPRLSARNTPRPDASASCSPSRP